MEINEVYSLIKKLVKSGAAEVSIETKELKLTVKNHSKEPIYVNNTGLISTPTPQPQHVNAKQEVEQNIVKTEEAKNSSKTIPEGYVTINSPMVGIFYRKPAPEKPTFVNVGDNIKTGDVVCLIEAMKLFNEIESEMSGKIIKALVDDGTPVEYDQPLFLVEPSA